MKKDCGFQYWDGRMLVEDQELITLDEAKQLWNKHYDDIVEKSEAGEPTEVAIWINMKDDSDYHETLIHLHAPEVKNGMLCELVYHKPF